MQKQNEKDCAMQYESTFNAIDAILRNEAGCSNELDYIEQTSWLLFLKYLDDLETDFEMATELRGTDYRRLITGFNRWTAWAAPKTATGELDVINAMTGDDLVTFDNIRIECPLGEGRGSLLHVKTVYNDKYSFAPGGTVEDVLFRNIRYYGNTPGFSIITGYSPERAVRNVRFEDLKINGVHIHDDMPTKPRWYHTSDKAGIYVGNYVEGLTFE